MSQLPCPPPSKDCTDQCITDRVNKAQLGTFISSLSRRVRVRTKRCRLDLHLVFCPQQISNCSSETKGTVSYLGQPQLAVAVACAWLRSVISHYWKCDLEASESFYYFSLWLCRQLYQALTQSFIAGIASNGNKGLIPDCECAHPCHITERKECSECKEQFLPVWKQQCI